MGDKIQFQKSLTIMWQESDFFVSIYSWTANRCPMEQEILAQTSADILEGLEHWLLLKDTESSADSQ